MTDQSPLYMSAAQVSVAALETLLAIVDTGTVTAAADRVHVTQAAASTRVRQLERALGAKLFLRSGRRLILSPAGERAADTARAVLAEIAHVKDSIADCHPQEAPPELRISTECYTCYHWLPSVFKPFNERWPKTALRVVAGATRRPIPALLRGEIDIAVVSHPTRDRRLRFDALFDDELVILVSPNHRWSRRTFVRPEELSSEHLILYDIKPGDRAVAGERLDKLGAKPATVTRMQITEAIVALVKADLGVTILARWAVAPELAAKSLCAVKLGSSGRRRRWYAATKVSDHRPAIADFIRLLRLHSQHFDHSNVA